ncbi:MAG: hypothetical protein PHW96_04315 [Candidatus Nanoarchaeia archaeon]|nr:hypothetical protein [Candidatus Nanoarchaeia archaeon]
MKIIGLDLSPNSTKPSGMSKMIDNSIYFFSTFSDSQIRKDIFEFKPDLVVVSSPLLGTSKKFRKCDYELKRREFKVQAMDTDYMKKLLSRTKKIRDSVKKVKFIETNAPASGKILSFDKSDELKYLRRMRTLGFVNMNKPKNTREMNAGINVIVGYLRNIGMAEELGDKIKIVIPIIK